LTLKQQKFSQSDPVLIRLFSKNCSPIQSWSGQNWLQSWSSPDPCSCLTCSAQHNHCIDKSVGQLQQKYIMKENAAVHCSKSFSTTKLDRSQLSRTTQCSKKFVFMTQYFKKGLDLNIWIDKSSIWQPSSWLFV